VRRRPTQPWTVRYPCGICAKPVKSNQRAVQCDFCDVLHHTNCMNIGKLVYEALANSSCIWECHSCGLPNFSRSLFESLSSAESPNRFSSLNDTQNMDASVSYQTSRGLPSLTSTPKKTSSLSSAQSAQKSRRLRLLNVNFQIYH